MKPRLLVVTLLWLTVSFRSALPVSVPQIFAQSGRSDSVRRLNNAAVRFGQQAGYAQALNLLQRARLGRPSDTVRYNEMLVLSRLQRYPEALATVTPLLAFQNGQLHRGLLRCHTGDWKGGLSDLEASSAPSEWADERAFNRSVAYYRLGQYEQAARALDEAMRLNADEPLYRLAQGNVRLMQNQYAEATRLYKTLEQIPTFQATVAVHLGNVQLYEQHFAAAARLFNQYLDSGEKTYHFSARYGLGNAWYGLKEFGKAATEYRKATQLQPKSTLAHTGLGNALCSQHNYSAAQRSFETALQLDSLNNHAHIGLGVVAYRQKHVEESLAQFAEAGPLLDPKNPDFADAYLHQGLSLVMAGQETVAQQALKTAAELRPDHPAAYMGLSELYRKAELFGYAIMELNLAIRHAPNDAKLLTNRGSLYLKRNDMDEAYPDFRRALRMNPRNLNALNGLGIALLERDQVEAARVLFDSLVIHGHHQAFLYNNRGIVRSYLGLKTEQTGQTHLAQQLFYRAQKDFEKAQQIDSSRNFYQNNLGNAFKNGLQYDKAIQSYQAYLSKSAINNLGVLYASNCQGDLSRHYLDIALQIDSTSLVYHYNRFNVYHDYFKDSLAKRDDIRQAQFLLPINSISAKYSRDGYINVYLYDYDFDSYDFPADHYFPIRPESPQPLALAPIDDYVLMPEEVVPAQPKLAASPTRSTRQRMPKAPKSRHRGSTECPTFY